MSKQKKLQNIRNNPFSIRKSDPVEFWKKDPSERIIKIVRNMPCIEYASESTREKHFTGIYAALSFLYDSCKTYSFFKGTSLSVKIENVYGNKYTVFIRMHIRYMDLLTTAAYQYIFDCMKQSSPNSMGENNGRSEPFSVFANNNAQVTVYKFTCKTNELAPRLKSIYDKISEPIGKYIFDIPKEYYVDNMMLSAAKIVNSFNREEFDSDPISTMWSLERLKSETARYAKDSAAVLNAYIDYCRLKIQ